MIQYYEITKKEEIIEFIENYLKYLKTAIEFLKGVGPKRSEVFNKELGIYCFEDLLNYYPYRYIKAIISNDL